MSPPLRRALHEPAVPPNHGRIVLVELERDVRRRRRRVLRDPSPTPGSGTSDARRPAVARDVDPLEIVLVRRLARFTVAQSLSCFVPPRKRVSLGDVSCGIRDAGERPSCWRVFVDSVRRLVPAADGADGSQQSHSRGEGSSSRSAIAAASSARLPSSSSKPGCGTHGPADAPIARISAAIARTGTSSASRFRRRPPVGPRTRSVIPFLPPVGRQEETPPPRASADSPLGGRRRPTACTRSSLLRRLADRLAADAVIDLRRSP